MRKEREIIIKVIEKNNISNKRLAQFFAKKYTEESMNIQKEKS